jgi:hypothetical protein
VLSERKIEPLPVEPVDVAARISLPVAVAFSAALFVSSISAAIVALVEPGAYRIAAAAVAAALFLLLVFGLASAGREDGARLVRRCLAALSKNKLRSGLTTALLAAFAAAAVVFGPSRTGFLLVRCLDAKRISRTTLSGRQLEDCGADQNAAFSAWFPGGRASFVNDIRCNYSSGDSVEIVAGEETCPLHQFSYAVPYDQSGTTFHWQRSLDGSWIERASSTNAYAVFAEVGPLSAEVPAPDGRRIQIAGVQVRRLPDRGNMELLLPITLVRNKWIYLRDNPTSPWKLRGTIVLPEAGRP